MKFKIDFVTNSSSSCFILSIPKEKYIDFKDYLKFLDSQPEASNEGARIYWDFETIRELKEHVNNGPLDWVKEIVDPNFENMDKERYEMCKEHINEGNIVCEAAVDYNVCEIFTDSEWSNYIISYDY